MLNSGRLRTTLAVTLIALGALLVACSSGSSAETTSTPAQDALVPMNVATAAPTVDSSPVAVTDSVVEADPMDGPAAAGGGTLQDDLIAKGESIFEQSCQACHGENAVGFIGPPIMGKTADIIELQFEINPAMLGLDLLPAQLEAMEAYLLSLGPPVPSATQ